ncbi:hypothetical protein CBR_g34363 [Chara braunii]|uniref:Integrase catalytic domain-containing protein n=1 Tax=Chara braunii TaxID=69332 RepID=A0A388LIL6_CHABU|nr:hypothetical protein CBR_g34363 [Chara braunii]|eukprot:GBG82083.1 hypothetical protein CBR_g34363 [Chara braunii]
MSVEEVRIATSACTVPVTEAVSPCIHPQSPNRFNRECDGNLVFTHPGTAIGTWIGTSSDSRSATGFRTRDGTGAGSGFGTGEGTRTGTGFRTSEGIATGPGSQTRTGTAAGTGFGTGEGLGTGPGFRTREGIGTGTRFGTGEGTATGPGPRSGTQTAAGTGFGTGEGLGSGPGFRTKEGIGTGTGTRFGTGEGTGTRAGFEAREGTGAGTGFPTGDGSGTGPGTAFGSRDGTGSGPGFGDTEVIATARAAREATGTDAGNGMREGTGFACQPYADMILCMTSRFTGSASSHSGCWVLEHVPYCSHRHGRDQGIDAPFLRFTDITAVKWGSTEDEWGVGGRLTSLCSQQDAGSTEGTCALIRLSTGHHKADGVSSKASMFVLVIAVAAAQAVAAPARQEEEAGLKPGEDERSGGQSSFGRQKKRTETNERGLGNFVHVPLPTAKLACHPYRRVAAANREDDIAERGESPPPLLGSACSCKPSRHCPVVLLSPGSFNPPTNWHLRMFELARDELVSQGYDVLGGYLSPVNDRYTKKGLESAAHRANMLELAVEDSDFLMVDHWEVSQPTYPRTIELLRRMDRILNGPENRGAERTRIVLICGADLLQSFTIPGVWIEDQVREILSSYGVVCITRGSIDVRKIIVENDLLYEYRRNIVVVDERINNGVSSSEVRRSLSHGLSVKYLVPEQVLQYIKKNCLYSSCSELAAANQAAREQATTARAAAMANGAGSAASSSASSSGTHLGMPLGPTGTMSSGQSISQMAGSQLSPLTPRGRELLELQQVERIRERLERELKQATDREREVKNRTARLDTLEADKAALEGLDESGMSDQLKVLKNNMMSLHAHVDSRLDFMQNSLDQILDFLQRPRIRPAAQSPLPLTAMSGPFPVQAGTQPSGTSAAAAQTVASSSSGPAVIATQPPQQPVPQQGQTQGQWYPKTPMKPPLAFSGEKKDEELNTWLRTVPVWVKAKRTLQEEEVITATSYLEGKATKWLDGLVSKAGYRRRMADSAKTITFDQFLEMVEARWHNPQQAQIATDAINRQDQRKFKSVRELTTTVKSLAVVPGINYDNQFLLATYVRCLPENLRNLLASEARLEYHSFETLSRKALDLEATLGNAQPSQNDARKKKSPQEWKKKGAKLMMVESDGTQTEIDELTDLLDVSEFDDEEIAEGSTLAAVIKAKAGGRVKDHQKSQRKAASNQTKVADWVKAGLDQEVWRGRRVRGACINCGNHPEANGQAEQMNRVVQHLLRHYIKPSQDDWDEKLPLIASLYNNAVHNSTGVSPNQLHLGWKPRSALDFLLPENRSSTTPGTLEYGVHYEKLLQQAVEHIKKAQQAMIASENKHRRQSSFQVGERVWVKASDLGQEFGISRKLMPQYFGPWEVLDVVGDEMDGPTYVIRIPGHLRTHPVFHASKLAPFAETDQFPSRRSMLPPTMDGQVDINDIVVHRDLPVQKPLGRGRPPKPKQEYRVRFRHHTDPKEDRWFTREELIDTAPQVVAEYERMLKGTAPAK